MRVRLQALGCRLNEAELETWARQLHQHGCIVVTDAEPADLLIINTCAVTHEAVRKSRKLLRRARRDNPRARLVVSGCAVDVSAEELGEVGIDLLVANTDKDRLVEIAIRELSLPLMPAAATTPGADTLFARGRQRAFIKIQDGCRHQCTFCISTRARGEERSRPIIDLCDEINALANKGLTTDAMHPPGIQEIVLTGVHIGGYGNDLDDNLVGLLNAILRNTDIPRIRLGSLEPWELPETFWRLFENPRLMPHLHLPLQSGSDSVLRRMARRCKPAEFIRLAERARAVTPDFNITTDIMVGFPGETDREWQCTLQMVEHVGFGHLHIFAFSPRAGTRAAQMPNQVPDAIKRTRSRELHALGLRIKRELLERQAGRRYSILVEGLGKDQMGRFYAGFTPGYLPVRLRSTEPIRTNSILPVRLAQSTKDGQAINASPDLDWSGL